jgi:nucleoside-diphosphate-sugar epimerase
MIAVTGATGLLGSSIIRKLLEDGEQVIAIKRKESDTSLLNDVLNKITVRDADILDPVALSDALQDVSVVIHAAGLVSFQPRDKKRLYETNVQGTRNIINTSLQHNIKKFIHVSSVAALGRPKDVEQLDEKQKWAESPFNTVYAESKYFAELEVMRGHEEGLEVVIVNPSVILGPGDWNKSSSKIFDYVWRERSFYSDMSINYVDVKDVTRAIIQLMNNGVDGERYILNAGNISCQLLFEKIAKNFKKKPPTIRVGKNLVLWLANLEQLRSLITGSTSLITKETAQLAKSLVTYNNQKIKNKLNFEFQTIDETLKWCCEYYMKKANGKK